MTDISYQFPEIRNFTDTYADYYVSVSAIISNCCCMYSLDSLPVKSTELVCAVIRNCSKTMLYTRYSKNRETRIHTNLQK